MVDLTGRVALVTGGSRGIGRAIVSALSSAGAALAVNYRDREEDAAAIVSERLIPLAPALPTCGGLEPSSRRHRQDVDRAGSNGISFVSDIRANGRSAIAVGADVSRSEAVQAMVQAVESGPGSIDILVNNAGIAPIRDIDGLNEQDFDRTIAVNLKSAFLCTQAVLPGMRARRWGRVVNMSSLAARGPGVVEVHYNASKAGLEGLTRGYAARLAREGITVNAVAPALIATEMTGSLNSKEQMDKVPLGRFGTVDEVAECVLMVVGNSFMTGQTIPINEGISFI